MDPEYLIGLKGIFYEVVDSDYYVVLSGSLLFSIGLFFIDFPKYEPWLLLIGFYCNKF